MELLQLGGLVTCVRLPEVARGLARSEPRLRISVVFLRVLHVPAMTPSGRPATETARDSTSHRAGSLPVSGNAAQWMIPPAPAQGVDGPSEPRLRPSGMPECRRSGEARYSRQRGSGRLGRHQVTQRFAKGRDDHRPRFCHLPQVIALHVAVALRRVKGPRRTQRAE